LRTRTRSLRSRGRRSRLKPGESRSLRPWRAGNDHSKPQSPTSTSSFSFRFHHTPACAPSISSSLNHSAGDPHPHKVRKKRKKEEESSFQNNNEQKQTNNNRMMTLPHLVMATFLVLSLLSSPLHAGKSFPCIPLFHLPPHSQSSPVVQPHRLSKQFSRPPDHGPARPQCSSGDRISV